MKSNARCVFSFAPSLLCALFGLSLFTAHLSAGQQPVADRTGAGADRVVVAIARNVTAAWQQTEHGDRIIVSHVLLEIEETLKGAGPSSALLEVDGGTLDGVTLRVSGLHVLEVGERAVVFMDAVDGGRHVPHGRGHGILRLDETNAVRGSTERLDDIRSRVRGAGL